MVRLFRKRSIRKGEQYGRSGNLHTRVLDFEHERRQDQPSFSNHSNSSTVGASLAPHDQFYLEVPIKNRIPKGILRSPKSSRQTEEEAASLDQNSTVSSITENTADFRRAKQKELQASLLHSQNNNNKSMVLRSKEHAQSRAKAYREQQQSTAASSRQTQSTSTLSVLVSSCFSCSTTAASQNVVLEEPNSIVVDNHTTSQPQEKTGGRLKDTGMFALCGGTPGPNDYVDEPPVAPITIDPRKYNDNLEEEEAQQQQINDHLQQQHQTITPVESCESGEDDEFLTYMEDDDEHDDAEREDVDTAVSIPPPPLPQFRTSSRGLSRGSSFKKSKSFQKVRSFLSSRGRHQAKQDHDPVIVPSSATAHQINGNNKYFLGQQRDEASSFVRQQYPPPPQFQSTHYYHERQPPKRHRSFQKVRSFLGREKKHHHQTNLYRAAE